MECESATSCGKSRRFRSSRDSTSILEGNAEHFPAPTVRHPAVTAVVELVPADGETESWPSKAASLSVEAGVVMALIWLWKLAQSRTGRIRARWPVAAMRATPSAHSSVCFSPLSVDEAGRWSCAEDLAGDWDLGLHSRVREEPNGVAVSLSLAVARALMMLTILSAESSVSRPVRGS